jgi:hypothetical protein
MVKMLFSIVCGANRGSAALTVCTGSVKNGAPSRRYLSVIIGKYC